jgi:hypothetical protein
MTDGWDDGYEDSIDDGHEFAEKFMSSPGATGGSGSDLASDATPSEKLDFGIVPAKFEGICVVHGDKINIDDPITHQDANGYPMNGWRHAGCIGPQAFTTRYKQAEKMTDDFLGHSEGPEAPSS